MRSNGAVKRGCMAPIMARHPARRLLSGAAPVRFLTEAGAMLLGKKETETSIP
jgi:hypothetical protein